MGLSAHSRWGPPLEQYVLRYDMVSARGRETLEEDIMNSARGCMQTITTLSEEADQAKFESLAERVSLKMLRCLWLLSSSGHGILYLAQPPLIRGCVRLMKMIKLDGVVSPFSYEYGYLCFNIAKMALGVCLVEKFHRERLLDLMNGIQANYLAKDTASMVAEQLFQLYSNETCGYSRGVRHCDWLFGWSHPPAHGGHSGLIISGPEALDLMDVLWNDRKALLKSLSAAYTPGASIIMFMIWQYMYRKGVLLEPVSRTPLLQSFLDLSWRFSLAATASDHTLMFPIIGAAMFYLGKVTKTAVDTEDSRNIIEAYIRGIPPIEDTLLSRHASLGTYPNIPHYVVRTMLPGTEDLYLGMVKSMLGRMWDMASWGQVGGTISPEGAVGSGLDDLVLLLRIHVQRLPPGSPVKQAIIEELVNQDILGLVGFPINRLHLSDDDPSERKQYSDLQNCIAFKNSTLSMITVIKQLSPSDNIPAYFSEYGAEWIKHILYNDILLQMAGGSENAIASAKFRRGLLWDLIKKTGSAPDIENHLNTVRQISCNYVRCPSPSWAAYTRLRCSLYCTFLVSVKMRMEVNINDVSAEIGQVEVKRRTGGYVRGPLSLSNRWNAVE